MWNCSKITGLQGIGFRFLGPESSHWVSSSWSNSYGSHKTKADRLGGKDDPINQKGLDYYSGLVRLTLHLGLRLSRLISFRLRPQLTLSRSMPCLKPTSPHSSPYFIGTLRWNSKSDTTVGWPPKTTRNGSYRISIIMLICFSEPSVIVSRTGSPITK